MDLNQLGPGAKLGSYLIDRQLVGGGGRGLFLAHDAGGKAVGLTVVESRHAARVAQLRAEFDALSRLRHPSIVRVLGWGEDAGFAFHVGEYVKGVPLHSLVLTGRLMLPGVMAVYGKVLESVAYMHANGVTHGSLSPANIMVRREGRNSVPVLVGFGISRVTSRAELSSGALAGALHFISPEHAAFLLGHGPGKTYEAGYRDDVYVMGVNLYFLLTGEWPVPRTSDTRQGQLEFLRRLRRHVPKPVLELNRYAPIQLSELAMRMLQVDPEARPADACVAHKEFAHARMLDRDDMDSIAILLDFAESSAAVEEEEEPSKTSTEETSAVVPLVPVQPTPREQRPHRRAVWVERSAWVAALLLVLVGDRLMVTSVDSTPLGAVTSESHHTDGSYALEEISALTFGAKPIPDKPLPGQKRPPCWPNPDGYAAVVINGGCWHFVATSKDGCKSDNFYEKQPGQCLNSTPHTAYMPYIPQQQPNSTKP
jgi:serine/threonine protein kinase